ncbi:proton-dependent oligopeptide transporter (POT family) [Legionella moravica]|uniref:Proton-dependent oligopeptide transporter (POT family) n=2 Tax=Legionella moravica TaxID=39962 RepID=A0A378K2J2_9GAMM|nr:proton-dependent oligopeptide transporter (POT family) [Legionella moravica]STX62071.1 putative Alkaline phosphatase [Legionella moravica]
MIESPTKGMNGQKMIHAIQKMPKGVTALYFIQAFSTFSFAILYSSLSLYITQQLGFSSTISNNIVGLFLAFNYVLHLWGGVLGGRYLSNRLLFFITNIMQGAGILVLVLSGHSMLYIGLSLFLVGCGLNTTCYNSILTQRFKAEDEEQRDKAFFLSYAAMNVGFFAGYILSGFYDYSNEYQELFCISIITSIITAVIMMFFWSDFEDTDTPLRSITSPISRRKRELIGIASTIILVPLMIGFFHFSHFSNTVVVILSSIMLLVILFLGKKQKDKADFQKIKAFLILTITSIIFWMIYYTGPMGITLFIKNNVDKHFGGYELATQWIMNINAIVIIVGAPIVSIVINKLRSKGFNLSISIQFVWAFLILALSFFFLTLGVKFADSNGFSSLSWVILHLIAQSVAELLIGPVGYAMIGKISPVNLQGVLMGTWMMVSGVSASLSHYFSNAMVKTEVTDPLITNIDFLNVFNELGIWALLGAAFLYFFSGKIRRLIDDIDERQTKIKGTTA